MTITLFNVWKSHSRYISILELEEMHLKIEDYEKDVELAELISAYHTMMGDYDRTNNFRIFVHTRLTIKESQV